MSPPAFLLDPLQRTSAYDPTNRFLSPSALILWPSLMRLKRDSSFLREVRPKSPLVSNPALPSSFFFFTLFLNFHLNDDTPVCFAYYLCSKIFLSFVVGSPYGSEFTGTLVDEVRAWTDGSFAFFFPRNFFFLYELWFLLVIKSLSSRNFEGFEGLSLEAGLIFSPPNTSDKELLLPSTSAHPLFYAGPPSLEKGRFMFAGFTADVDGIANFLADQILHDRIRRPPPTQRLAGLSPCFACWACPLLPLNHFPLMTSLPHNSTVSFSSLRYSS